MIDNKKVFYIHEHEHEDGVRFTAAVTVDRDTQEVQAAFAYVNPLDNFRKVRGRGISYSRLNRQPALSYKVAINSKISDILSVVRNIGILQYEEQRNLINDLVREGIYVSHNHSKQIVNG